MYTKFLLALAITAFIGACAKNNELDLKEGKWSIVTTMDMPNMPFQMPPVRITQCLTKQDYMPRQEEAKNESLCQIVNKKVKGSTVSWDVKCPDSKSHTVITYNYDSFSGDTKVETTAKGEKMLMSSHIEGQYIGSCK